VHHEESLAKRTSRLDDVGANARYRAVVGRYNYCRRPLLFITPFRIKIETNKKTANLVVRR